MNDGIPPSSEEKMQHPDYNSPAALKSFMEQNGFAMQKKFGQNFMVTESARRRIAEKLGAGSGASVWEVGPGLGSMTEILLEQGASVTAFEIDHGFAALLPQFFSAHSEAGSFRLVQGDVLRTWREQAALVPQGTDVMLFGNLPYNIAATLVADTITSGMVFSRCVLTVQKEVAMRMAAKPSGPNYSAFSVLCQRVYSVKPFMELPPAAFWPRPSVASEAVLLERLVGTDGGVSPAFFARVVHALFSNRRKTLSNNMRQLLPAESADSVLSSCGISRSERAENLSVAEFMRLSQTVQSAMMGSHGGTDGN